MSFRKQTNRHDEWIVYRDRNAATLAKIGLPRHLFDTERELGEFLTVGSREDIAADLDSLSKEQFEWLFRFVTAWFDCHAVDFTAMERRRLNG